MSYIVNLPQKKLEIGTVKVKQKKKNHRVNILGFAGQMVSVTALSFVIF